MNRRSIYRFAGWAAILITVTSLILAGCGTGTESGGSTDSAGYQNIDIDEAKRMIDEENPIILDVRTEQEYNEGHIPGAQLYPLQEIESWYGQLDPEQTYLVICRSGNRSTQASEFLSGKGFNHLYNVMGGMNEWTYEVEK